MAKLPDRRGHFGVYGGRFVPETLMEPLIELERAYRAARRDRGARQELPPELAAQVRALRRVTRKPVCVGFGIGTPEQAATVGALADGVVVGSAIVRCVETHASSPQFVSEVGDFIAALKAPLRN